MPMTEEKKTFGELFSEIEDEIDADEAAGGEEPTPEPADGPPAEDKKSEEQPPAEDKKSEEPPVESSQEPESNLAEQLEEAREEPKVEQVAPDVFEVTIDGKTIEVDREELLRGYQTAQSSTRRFQDAKKLHQEAKAFFQEIQKSPGEALLSLYEKQVGDPIKAREMVRDTFLEFLAPDLEEQMIEDENEKKLRRREREIETKQKALERKEREAKERAQREADAEFISSLESDIRRGLKKFGLPDTNLVWKKAGAILGAAEEAGSSRTEILGLVDVVLKQIKDERDSEARSLISTLSAEELEAMFPDQAKDLRALRVERVREAKSPGAVSENSSEDGPAEDVEAEITAVAEERRRNRGRKKLPRKHFHSDEVFDSIPT